MKRNLVFVPIVIILGLLCIWTGFEYYNFSKYNSTVEAEDIAYKLELKEINKRMLLKENDMSLVDEMERRIDRHESIIKDAYDKYMKLNLIFR